jgi:hypothetical protein
MCTQLNTGVLRQARLRLSGIGLPVPAYGQSENIPTQAIADKIPVTLKGEFAPFSFVYLLQRCGSKVVSAKIILPQFWEPGSPCTSGCPLTKIYQNL